MSKFPRSDANESAPAFDRGAFVRGLGRTMGGEEAPSGFDREGFMRGLGRRQALPVTEAPEAPPEQMSEPVRNIRYTQGHIDRVLADYDRPSGPADGESSVMQTLGRMGETVLGSKPYLRVMNAGYLVKDSPLLNEAAGAIMRGWRGDGVNRGTFIDEFLEKNEQRARELDEKYPEAHPLVGEVAHSMGVSLPGMAGALPGAMVGAMVGAAGGPVGAFVGGFLGGALSSGAVMYRVTKDMFLSDVIEHANIERALTGLPPLSVPEQEGISAEYDRLGTEYGLAEGTMEGIGNMVSLGIGGLLAKSGAPVLGAMLQRAGASKLGGKILANRASRAAASFIEKSALVGGNILEELATETATEKWQSDVERRAGLRDETLSWGESFDEIRDVTIAQTLAMTPLTALAGRVSADRRAQRLEALRQRAAENSDKGGPAATENTKADTAAPSGTPLERAAERVESDIFAAPDDTDAGGPGPGVGAPVAPGQRADLLAPAQGVPVEAGVQDVVVPEREQAQAPAQPFMDAGGLVPQVPGSFPAALPQQDQAQPPAQPFMDAGGLVPQVPGSFPAALPQQDQAQAQAPAQPFMDAGGLVPQVPESFPAALQQPQEPAQETGPVPGEVGGRYAAGQVVLTVTGRETSPFPNLDFSSERKTDNTTRRVEQWLMRNAFDEATARGDKFNAPQFELAMKNPKNISQSDRDSAEMYLFDREAYAAMPPPVPSVLRPLAPQTPAQEQPAPAPEPKDFPLLATWNPDGSLSVTGKTFDRKELLRRLGGRFDGKTKEWTFPRDKAEQVHTRLSARGDLPTMQAPQAPRPQTDQDRVAAAVTSVLRAGHGFEGINSARQLASVTLGRKIEPGTQDAKMVDEAVEQALVSEAREIVANAATPLEAFDALLDLYQRQPNLGVRTGQSMADQAYSTPLPLAFVASRLADVSGGTVIYEPTAGNGALLIEADPAKVRANELNPERVAALEAQGFTVTMNDATAMATPEGTDRIIANPPFGKVQGEDGGTRSWFHGSIEFTKVDHAIVTQALSGMRPDGKAVLIIGGKKTDSRGAKARETMYASAAERAFWKNLMSSYNVTSVLTVDGNLYKKQGAGFPVDIVVVGGKGKTDVEARPFPWTSAPQVLSSWEQIREVLENAERGDAPAQVEPRMESGRDGPDGTVPGDGRPRDMDSRRDDEPSGRGDAQEPVGGQGQLPDTTRGDARGTDAAGNVRGTPVVPEQSDAAPGVAEDARGQEPAAGRAPVRDGAARRDSAESGIPGVPGEDSGGPGTGERAPGRRPVGVGEGRDVSLGSVKESAVEETPAQDKPRAPKQAKAKPEQTAFQTPYAPRSRAGGMGVLAPANMADTTQRALDAVQEKHGDVDAFVAAELGYPVEKLGDHFSAEQVDALALALEQIKNKNGFILGDQTGIGKGRVCAAVIRWARRQGVTPVFITKDTALYSAMLEDLYDIGEGSDFTPFITNTQLTGKKAVVGPDADGDMTRVITTGNAAERRAAMNDFIQSGSQGFAQGFGAVFTTYSQLASAGKGMTERQSFIMNLAPRALFILDESHEAGGSGSGQTRQTKAQRAGLSVPVSKLLRTALGQSPHGVLYSSATFAKNPHVMGLYFKTGLRHVVANPEQLGEAIGSGGVPLQQATSLMLSEAGQFVRRERSFAGVTYDTAVVPVKRSFLDGLAKIMHSVMAFEKAITPILNDIKDSYNAQGDEMRDSGGTRADSASFAATMHNVIAQSLLAAKATEVAREAVALIKAGKKPVIAVSNTMQMFIDEMADAQGLKPGDPFLADFGDVLNRYLEKQRTITIKTTTPGPNGGRTVETVERVRIEDAQLPAEVLSAYNETRALIDGSDLSGLPPSPIDAIKEGIRDAGYVVDEITGRSSIVEDGAYKKRDVPSGKAKRAIMDKFNGQGQDATIDALVINASGSTGISLHASEKFRDQRPRHMLIAQPHADINVFMQTLGRIHRTGQVALPAYTNIAADAPAETRYAAALAKKMASLNANTTANRRSAQMADALDFLNEHGDAVAVRLVEEMPEINAELFNPLPLEDKGGEAVVPSAAHDGAMRKLTGRIPVLPVSRQEEIYSILSSEFQDYMDALEEAGTSQMEAKTEDLKAVTLSSEVLVPGSGQQGFGGDVVVEKIEADRTNPPYTPAQVRAQVAESLGVKAESDDAEFKRAGLEHVEKLTRDVAAKFETFAREVMAKRAQRGDSPEAIAAAVRVLEATARNTLNKFRVQGLRIGAKVSFLLGDAEAVGVVTNIVHKGLKTNPGAATQFRVTIALLDGAKQVTLPVSRVMQDSATVMSNVPLSAALRDFDVARHGREQRAMLTGNLLAAWANLKDMGDSAKGARIVRYTQKSGQVGTGILLPRAVDADALVKNMDVPFYNGRSVADFAALDTEPRGGRTRVAVASTNGVVTGVSDGHGSVRFSLPKNAEGRGIAITLLNSTGANFVSAGNRLVYRAEAPEVAGLAQALIDAGYPLKATTNRDAAKAIITGSRPVAMKGDSGEVTGARREGVEKEISGVKLPEGVAVGVVQSVADLPAEFWAEAEELSGGRPGVLKGMFGGGRVFLIADGIAPGEAQKTLLHELRHFGLRALLGRRFSAVMGLVWGNKNLRPAVQHIADAYGYDINTLDGRAMAVEETLVRLGDAGITASVMDRVVAVVRGALRSMGFSVRFSDAEVRALVTRAGEHSGAAVASPLVDLSKAMAWEKKLDPQHAKNVHENLSRLIPKEWQRKYDPAWMKGVLTRKEMNLLHWLAQPREVAIAFPAGRPIFEREQERREEKNVLSEGFLNRLDKFFALRGEAFDTVRALIWNLEGQSLMRETARRRLQKGKSKDAKEKARLEAIAARGLTERPFALVRDENGRPVYQNGVALRQQNDKHYEQLREFLSYGGKVSPEAVDAYVELRRALDSMFLAVEAAMMRLGDWVTASDISLMRKHAGRIQNYFPHKRYGAYFVKAHIEVPVLDKEGNQVFDAEGNPLVRRREVHDERFDAVTAGMALKKAMAIRARLLAENPDLKFSDDAAKPWHGKSEKLSEEVFRFPIPVDAIQQVVNAAAERMGNTKEQQDAIKAQLENAVADTLKMRGFGSHMIRRKGLSGFEKDDIHGVLVDYVMGLSGWISKMNAAKDFTRMLGKLDGKGREYEYWAGYVQDMLRNQDGVDRVVGKIKAAAFIMYLAWRTSTLSINLTQNYVLGIPRMVMDMTGKRAYARAFARWHKAAKDTALIMAGKSDHLTPEEQAAVGELYLTGVTRDTYVQDVMGKIRMHGMRGLGNRIMYALAWPMQATERFNRISMSLAAYRIARAGGFKDVKTDHESAIAAAREMVLDAHFIYGKSNQPRITQLATGNRALLGPSVALRSFVLNAVGLWWRWVGGRTGAAGRKAFAQSMLAQWAFGGMRSIALFGTFAAALNALLGWATGDDNFDILEEIRRKAGKLGVPTMLLDVNEFGLPAIVGVNLGGSLAIDLPGVDIPAKVDNFDEYVGKVLAPTVLGVPYDMARRPSRAYEAAMSEEYGRAAEQLLPSFLANPVRAHRMATRGAETLSGKPINFPGHLGPRKLSARDTVLTGLGYQPLESTKAWRLNQRMQDLQNKRLGKQTIFANKMIRTLRDGDADATKAILEDVKKWNERQIKAGNTALVITRKNLVGSVRSRAKNAGLPPQAVGQAIELLNLYGVGEE